MVGSDKKHPGKRSALNTLFTRQQSKVVNTPRQGALLKAFAEEDHKRIAKLIQVWLEADERRKTTKPE